MKKQQQSSYSSQKKNRKKMTKKKTHLAKEKTAAKKKTRKKGSKTKKKIQKSSKQRFKRLVIDILLTLSIFSCLLLPVFIFVLQVPKINGYAMTPALEPNQRVIVYRQGKIKRFSFIYFNVPDRSDGLKTIRRVIGLPGDQIEYKSDVLYVNGEEKTERFLSEEIKAAKKEGYQLTDDFSIQNIEGGEGYKIPEGYYLVLGDNRAFSVDSRTYGLISEKSIIGTVVLFL